MSTLKDLLTKLINEQVPMVTVAGTVKAVDEEALTCDVAPSDGPLMYDVRLRAAIDGRDTGVIQIPKVGSLVLVSLIENNVNSAFVVAFSEVSRVIINVPEVVINGGENKGVIIIDKLKAQIEHLNTYVETLKKCLTEWAPVANDGGAALKAYAATQLATMQKADLSEVTNEKVKH